MAVSLIQACRSLALSTWLLSFCFVHLLCLDFTVAEKEEWYTAFVNITYPEPGAALAGSELRSEKSECGRYGEHSPKHDVWGQVAMTAGPAADRQACDPNARFAAPAGPGKVWIALIPKGNCTYKDKVRHAAAQNASAVVIYNVGASNANETITMPPAGFITLEYIQEIWILLTQKAERTQWSETLAAGLSLSSKDRTTTTKPRN